MCENARALCSTCANISFTEGFSFSTPFMATKTLVQLLGPQSIRARGHDSTDTNRESWAYRRQQTDRLEHPTGSLGAPRAQLGSAHRWRQHRLKKKCETWGSN